MSHHVLIRLIRFVSRFTVYLCNAIYFLTIFSILYKRFIKILYFSFMDLKAKNQTNLLRRPRPYRSEQLTCRAYKKYSCCPPCLSLPWRAWPPSPVKQQRWRMEDSSGDLAMDGDGSCIGPSVLLLPAMPRRQRRELKAEAHVGEGETGHGGKAQPSAASSAPR